MLCRVCNEQIGVWAGFSQGFSHFPPVMHFVHFTYAVVVSQQPSLALTFMGLHLISRLKHISWQGDYRIG